MHSLIPTLCRVILMQKHEQALPLLRRVAAFVWGLWGLSWGPEGPAHPRCPICGLFFSLPKEDHVDWVALLLGRYISMSKSLLVVGLVAVGQHGIRILCCWICCTYDYVGLSRFCMLDIMLSNSSWPVVAVSNAHTNLLWQVMPHFVRCPYIWRLP